MLHSTLPRLFYPARPNPCKNICSNLAFSVEKMEEGMYNRKDLIDFLCRKGDRE